MSPERARPHVPRRWSLHSSWGEIGFAGLLLAAVSGIAVAVPYDAQRPYDSLALLVLTNPAAALFRNLHYWAGQLFLVLTLAHAWDHLSRWTESRVPRAMWWRVTASLPLAAFVMLSGFMLKGDAEARQAIRIVTSLLDGVPWGGRLISVALVGVEGNRQILYVHHVATASILVWLFVAEHARAIWPRLVTLVETMLPIVVVSLFVSPGLHDGLDPVLKGPWYFLGLQEALHWISRPLVLVAAGVGLFLVVGMLPRVSDRTARWSKRALAATALLYALLTVTGLYFRGEDWSFSPGMAGQPAAGSRWLPGLVVHGIGRWSGPPTDALLASEVPVVLGRREGCLFCHRGVTGLSRSHSAEAVGCASCHAGDPFSLDKAIAHARMLRVPGNLASARRACGTEACHPSQVERVPRSLMATMAGVVAVDRAVWEGQPAEGQPPDVASLGHSGPDEHLRQLCASCHVGGDKAAPGPVGEESRGGGCSACHLQYSDTARAELTRYLKASPADGGASWTDVPSPRVHPDISIRIERTACFGCHSRSGRISIGFEGWHELGEGQQHRGDGEHRLGGSSGATEAGTGASTRTLADGRILTFVSPDVHARNMDCIDCHGAREAMGDGVERRREHEAVRVACTDCHVVPGGSGPRPSVVALGELDTESRRIADLRGRNAAGDRFLATAEAGHPLVNTVVDADGRLWLDAKSSGRRLPMKPPLPVCTSGPGHERLSCLACHAAWAPRCPECHTSFEPGRRAVDLLDGRTITGAWVEKSGAFEALPPTLGLRATPAGQTTREVVETFIPGMVMTLDRNQVAGARPDVVFRRLYARSFSHTIGRKVRSCQSCHADPVALGYGQGSLRYERDGAVGRWRFEPRHRPGPDGRPLDAWIGFLEERTAAVSTRNDVRPFSLEEQKRILTVGACLTCHQPEAKMMSDFGSALKRVSPKCLLPAW